MRALVLPSGYCAALGDVDRGAVSQNFKLDQDLENNLSQVPILYMRKLRPERLACDQKAFKKESQN